jgi:hypothetical protein
MANPGWLEVVRRDSLHRFTRGMAGESELT